MARRRRRHAAAGLAPSPDPLEQRHPVEDVELGGTPSLGIPRSWTNLSTSFAGDTIPLERSSQQCACVDAEKPARHETEIWRPRVSSGSRRAAAPRDHAASRRRPPASGSNAVSTDHGGRAESPTRADQPERHQRARRDLRALSGRLVLDQKHPASERRARASSRRRCEDPRPRPRREVPEDPERLPGQGHLQCVRSQPSSRVRIWRRPRGDDRRGRVELDSDHPAGVLQPTAGSGGPVPAPNSTTRSWAEMPACATSSDRERGALEEMLPVRLRGRSVVARVLRGHGPSP